MGWWKLRGPYESRIGYFLFAVAMLSCVCFGGRRDAPSYLNVAGYSVNNGMAEPKTQTQSTWLGTDLSTVAPWGSGACYTIGEDGTITFDTRLLYLLSGVKCVRFVDWSLVNNGTTESKWTDRATLETARMNPKDFRVPLEVQVALCNTLRCGGWFCVPHLATADYARRMAQLIANNLDPDLLAIIEYSNECWNNLYVQARWCQDQGLARYPNARPAEAQTFFYVDRALQVFQIFGPRFKHVLCFHFGADRLIREGLLHAAEVGGWNLRSFVDAVAVAPYFGLAVARDPNIAGMTPTQVLYALANTELPRVTAGLAKTVELLAPAKLPLWAYESGQHLVDRQAGEDVQRLFRAVNVDPRMEDLYRAYFQIWLDTVGPTLCMHYSLACKPSRFGYWGMVDSLDQTDSPKLRGFRAALAQGS